MQIYYIKLNSSYGEAILAFKLENGAKKYVYCGFLPDAFLLEFVFEGASIIEWEGGELNIGIDDLIYSNLKWDDLSVEGSEFEVEVWRVLFNLKKDELVSYSDVAALTSHPTAVRRVATIIGRNKISLIIPCHLVVPADTKRKVLEGKRVLDFGNYGWGRERKAQILADILCKKGNERF